MINDRDIMLYDKLIENEILLNFIEHLKLKNISKIIKLNNKKILNSRLRKIKSPAKKESKLKLNDTHKKILESLSFS